ncbi:MAG: hypothetical protein K2Q26_07275 [Bdellovibrionales bacterium]|nr:hypothetical protein [Bdellovibrionales bacterium]
MRPFSIFATYFFAITVGAQQVSDLYKEFNRRDSIKFDANQGNVMNYLRLLKVPTEKITALELMPGSTTGSFIFQDLDGLICVGSVEAQGLRCKNKLGFDPLQLNEKEINIEATEKSDLYNEFVRRDTLILDHSQKVAINFMNVLKYPVEKVTELEMIPGTNDGSFLIRDTAGMICLGNFEKQMLRCKNALGITGVVYQGDAD